MGSQTTQRRATPIGLVALDAAIELNDILNALGLRVALLRHQPQSEPPTTGNMERLAELVDKAVECVRNLQDYIRAEQLVGAIRTALIERELAATTGASERSQESKPRTRVLLIGKDRSEAGEDSSLKSGLERSGCDVIAVGSAADGLKALENEPEFDNIVCDSEILAENGWDFASEVSRAAPAAKIYLLQNDSHAEPRVLAGFARLNIHR